VQINRRNFEECAQQSANRPPKPVRKSPRAFRLQNYSRSLSQAKPDVPSWQAALATETAGPRIRRSDDELKLERHFQLIPALTTGETDDPLELERRADEAMLAVAGFKSIKTGKAR
jgi:hypothetical protein